MGTKLKIFTFRTYKWREENGYTTPEWEMFVDNRHITGMISSMLVGVVAFIYGVVIGPAYIQDLQYIPYVPSESIIADLGFIVWGTITGILDLLSLAAFGYLCVVAFIGFWNRLGTGNDIVLKKCILHKALWWHRALMAKATVEGD